MNPFMILSCTAGVLKIFTRNFGLFKAIWLLAGSITGSGKVFRDSAWGERDDAEAKYVKSIALLPAIYLRLKAEFPESATMKAMNEIVIKVSWSVDLRFIKKHKLLSIENSFTRWRKYRNKLASEGFGLFNDIRDVEVTEQKMHYIVYRCIFHDFMSRTGVPELTRLICDYDKLCQAKLFPELEFDRNGAPENTLGHGSDCCHYLWQLKSQG